MKPDPLPDWTAFAFVYHGSRDRLLVEVILPLVQTLRQNSLIQRFFFVRYGLGGPHVRLRLCCSPADRSTIQGVAETLACEFFRRSPSETIPDEVIRQENLRIIANDLDGDEGVIYPNHSLLEVPFHPETQRYGGQDLLPPSLDLFAISSICALKTLRMYLGRSKSTMLSGSLRSLARLALGLAADNGDFLDFARYAEIWGHGAEPLLLRRGDEAFEKDSKALCRLLRQEIEACESHDVPLLAAAGRCLRREIGGAHPPVLGRIVASHLHMMANRLGLNNAEEVYLGRILWRAGQRLAETDSAFWDRFQEAAASWRAEVSLREMVSSALDALTTELAPPQPS